MWNWHELCCRLVEIRGHSLRAPIPRDVFVESIWKEFGLFIRLSPPGPSSNRVRPPFADKVPKRRGAQVYSMTLPGVCRATIRGLGGGLKVPTRLFSSSVLVRKEGESKPPRPIDDSTSALDYKKFQRHRPPPLPAVELPRSRSAEEAVTNILYNTPPPSTEPFKKSVSQ